MMTLIAFLVLVDDDSIGTNQKGSIGEYLGRGVSTVCTRWVLGCHAKYTRSSTGRQVMRCWQLSGTGKRPGKLSVLVLLELGTAPALPTCPGFRSTIGLDLGG